MAFSEQVKDEAYIRADGKCECTRKVCGHNRRCNSSLVKGWHAHHITSQAAGGEDTLANCEALCVSCHQNTGSYGG